MIGIRRSHFKSVGYRWKWTMYLGRRHKKTTQSTINERLTRHVDRSKSFVMYQPSHMRRQSLRRDQLVSVVKNTANVL